MSTWSPFDRNGNLRIVTYTDPWWKRLYARLRGEPLWHDIGYLAEEGLQVGDIRARVTDALRNALEDCPIASWTNWDDDDLPILADAVIEELGLE